MEIKELEINNIGGISDLKIKFNSNLNLLCGPNGVGKTTILECIGHAFSRRNTNILKKKKNSDEGKFNIKVARESEELINQSFELIKYEPHEKEMIRGLSDKSQKILVLKTNRHFSYKQLNSVARDKDKDETKTRDESYSGINYNDIKDWFIQRVMWEPHENGLSSTQEYNLKLAKDSFNNLDDSIKYSRVIPDTYDIVVDSPQGEIHYEYLSSGYKSCLSIILGLIKEIEFRFKDPRIRADQFNGIILIDEFDLHLHPSWQSKIAKIVTETFPKAQIIAATHSPHMIQAAKPDEIIPLEFNDDREVSLRNIESSEFGYQGWTIQEILTDIMGMEGTRSSKFEKLKDEFFEAIDNQEKEEAYKLRDELSKILHPQNYLNKIIELELSSLQ